MDSGTDRNDDNMPAEGETMKAADRELIRLTAEIYLERFKKWPDSGKDEEERVQEAAKIARGIMDRTYGDNQAARIRNLDKELEFYKEQNMKLQELRSHAVRLVDKLDTATQNKNVLSIMRVELLDKEIPQWAYREHPNV